MPATVVLLASAASIHTLRWAEGLCRRGMAIHIISLHPRDPEQQPAAPDAQVHVLPHRAPLGYWTNARALRRLLRRIRPDLVHAHYASGYGTLARAAGLAPTLLSAWGSDVYDFPNRSRWHLGILRRNLAHATALTSTSRAMAGRMLDILPGKPPFITPFGVDTDIFRPRPDAAAPHDGEIVIGTVKTLAYNYGIDRLLQAFALLKRRLAKSDPRLGSRLRLRIYGTGPAETALKRSARRLQLDPDEIFLGAIPHREVAGALAGLDIFVALSRRESFGVAVLEASACGCPVVVSDADGLAEITEEGRTGYIVPSGNPVGVCDRLQRLASDPALRHTMGRAGREHVLECYSWQHSIDLMIQAYEQTLQIHRAGAPGRAA